MSPKKLAILMTLIFAIFIVSGCAVLPGCEMEENDEEEAQQVEEEEMPEEIEEIENRVLEIMQQADLIPVINMISEIEEDEENENEEENGEEDEEGDENEDENEQEEYDLEETIILEDVLLSEVLIKEMEAEDEENQEEKNQYPQNAEEIWDNIENTLLELYEQWDNLEPQLAGENISPDYINSFEETLDRLTISSTEQNYFDTLTNANELTQYLPVFMVPFAENCMPAAYELKYHTRNIILTAAADNYEEAQDSMNYMKQLEGKLSEDLEENDAEETAEQLDISLSNLQRVVDKQNLVLIKVNAAVTMENIMQVIEDLE